MVVLSKVLVVNGGSRVPGNVSLTLSAPHPPSPPPPPFRHSGAPKHHPASPPLTLAGKNHVYSFFSSFFLLSCFLYFSCIIIIVGYFVFLLVSTCTYFYLFSIHVMTHHFCAACVPCGVQFSRWVRVAARTQVTQ